MTGKDLSAQLKNLLLENGATLAGIGHLGGSAFDGMDKGVSVAIAVPENIVRDLRTAPTREYYDMYHAVNSRLNHIVLAGERFLKDLGYRAHAQTTERVVVDGRRISRLPHKSVATRAGLGWIGKNCLLVNPEFGCAMRLSSLVTDAPLAVDKPVETSSCGACEICVRACPAGALKGTLWRAGTPRADIVDVEKCYRKQLEIMRENVGIETDLCGKCFAVCAYTRKRVK